MNPHDPRRPPGGPPYPQGGYPGQGAQQPQYGAGPYPQPQQGPQYPQQQPQYPQQQQPQYPQQQQQPYGQPQYGPGPQAQAPYYGGQAGPAKPGGGVGKIIAIVAAALVVLLAVGGVVAYLMFGRSLSEDEDHSALLQKRMETMMTAVQAGDVTAAKDSILEVTILPDTAQKWLKETYGPALGQEIYEEWERDVFAKLPELIAPFREAKNKGATKIKVTRFTKVTPEFREIRRGLMTKRKKQRALYMVTFMRPEDDYGDDLCYFAIVDGQFGYLGDMVSGW